METSPLRPNFIVPAFLAAAIFCAPAAFAEDKPKPNERKKLELTTGLGTPAKPATVAPEEDTGEAAVLAAIKKEWDVIQADLGPKTETPLQESNENQDAPLNAGEAYERVKKIIQKTRCCFIFRNCSSIMQNFTEFTIQIVNLLL